MFKKISKESKRLKEKFKRFQKNLKDSKMIQKILKDSERFKNVPKHYKSFCTIFWAKSD